MGGMCEEEANDSKWKRNVGNCLPLTHTLRVMLLFSASVSTRSPGRSPSCYDNEIVMMNHVYKERFPKVSLVQTNVHSQCAQASAPFARNPWFGFSWFLLWPCRASLIHVTAFCLFVQFFPPFSHHLQIFSHITRQRQRGFYITDPAALCACI